MVEPQPDVDAGTVAEEAGAVAEEAGAVAAHADTVAADAGAVAVAGTAAGGAVVPKIAGLSALKGLILYGATLAFAGLYAYFIAKILAASSGHPPKLDTALVTAAAGLAGVLGSGFALEIGSPTAEHATNPALKTAVAAARKRKGSPRKRALTRLRQALSLEPALTDAASWPKTFGIWVYAVVASAVAVTYVLNQHETPSAIKALAVAFAGYVISLISTAYGLVTK